MERKLPPHPAILASLYGSSLLFTLLAQFIPPFWFMTIPLNISSIVLHCIFWFRLWELAQASDLEVRKPSPGKAVGFIFIPFYGLYWLFILYRNLALHLNHLTGQNRIPVLLVTIGCALTVSIVLVDVGAIILQIINFYFYKSARELVSR